MLQCNAATAIMRLRRKPQGAKPLGHELLLNIARLRPLSRPVIRKSPVSSGLIECSNKADRPGCLREARTAGRLTGAATWCNLRDEPGEQVAMRKEC